MQTYFDQLDRVRYEGPKSTNPLVSVAGNSETKMLVYLMLTVAGLGAFMSSTGVVA
ncbi:hypothetical protein ACSLNU_17295, partial [Klebsiella variicola]